MPGGAGSLGAGHPAYAPVSGAARGVVRGRAHVAREVRGGATLGEQLAAPDAPLETSLRHGETDLGQRAPTAHGSRLLGVGLGGRPEELRVVGGAPRHGTVQLERVLGRGTEAARAEGRIPTCPRDWVRWALRLLVIWRAPSRRSPYGSWWVWWIWRRALRSRVSGRRLPSDGRHEKSRPTGHPGGRLDGRSQSGSSRQRGCRAGCHRWGWGRRNWPSPGHG